METRVEIRVLLPTVVATVHYSPTELEAAATLAPMDVGIEGNPTRQPASEGGPGQTGGTGFPTEATTTSTEASTEVITTTPEVTQTQPITTQETVSTETTVTPPTLTTDTTATPPTLTTDTTATPPTLTTDTTATPPTLTTDTTATPPTLTTDTTATPPTLTEPSLESELHKQLNYSVPLCGRKLMIYSTKLDIDIVKNFLLNKNFLLHVHMHI